MLMVFQIFCMFCLIEAFMRYITWSTEVMREYAAAHDQLTAWRLDNPLTLMKHSEEGREILERVIALELRLPYTFLHWDLFWKKDMLEWLYDLKYYDPRPEPPPKGGLPEGSPLSFSWSSSER